MIGGESLGFRKSVIGVIKGKDVSEDAILMSEAVANWMTTQSLCGEG